MSEYDIKFIPKSEAYFIFIKAPHLERYSGYELSSPNRQYKYNDFEDFNLKEQSLLHACIQEINAFSLFPLENINFMKTKAGKDWDFPHTFVIPGLNVIILSSKTIYNFSISGIKNRRFQETILHEIIHLHQKRNQNDYNEYYKKVYNFMQIPIENYELQRESMITNPDGYYTNSILWIIKIKGDLWFPYLDISMEERLRKVEKNIGKYYLTNIYASAEIIQEFQSMFPVQSQRYHPNEIFARINSKKLIFGRDL